MKKKMCLILVILLCVCAVLSGCYGDLNPYTAWKLLSADPIGDLTGKDTYEGLPLYQYNVEDNTVEIDGATYHPVEYAAGTVMKMGEMTGFLWYKPHYEIEDGVIYTISMLSDYPDKEYLYAMAYTFYQTENGKVQFRMLLKRED